MPIMNRADPSSKQQTLTFQQAMELAVRHHTAGDLSKAESIYQQILNTDPKQPNALHLLGVICHQAGESDRAVDLITKALDINPNYAEAHSNLGLVFQGLGLLDEAVASCQKALAIKPDDAEVHSNLGYMLRELGQLDDAVNSFHNALVINPSYAEAHSNLGLSLQDLGKLDEAVASYKKAIDIKPDLAEAHANLGNVLRELGKLEEAFTCYRRAVILDPQRGVFLAGLAVSLEAISFTSVDDKLLQDLLHLLEQPTVRASQVTRPIISALRCHPEFSQLLELTGSEKPGIGIAYGDMAEQLSEIPLFLRIMQLCPINDLKLEWMLTFLRQAMLQETMAGKTDERSLPFSSALALHCFVNEYIFQETKEETAAVEQLLQQIATLVDEGQDIPPSLVATVAAYRPLYEFAWAQELCEHEWIDNIKEVITRQISEPQEEQSLRSQIPQLTSIKNAVSESVRQQYEENPYPRWVKPGLDGTGGAIGAVLRKSPLRLDLGEYESPENPEILVAGCGTGQHALVTASRFSNARVLAVDLSLSSLSYALRKTKELGCSNIEYAQADILELGALGRQFDLIECVGVLHHLGDPLAGWRVLVDLLRPGGIVKIGLYSETARQQIIDGRSLIAEKGYTTSPEDIRRCREDFISKAKHGNRTMVDICNSPSFFSLSNCRDMLFHVQEHGFTLPQIEGNLQALKLRFLGFEMGGQRTFKKFEKSHPGKQALTSLPLWHKFELQNPGTFRAMYQFWCKKK